MSAPSRFSNLTRRLILALPLLLVATLALAQSRVLDAPRAAGTVGERFDGFAVVRDAAQAGTLTPLVNQVNAERRKVYSGPRHGRESLGRPDRPRLRGGDFQIRAGGHLVPAGIGTVGSQVTTHCVSH